MDKTCGNCRFWLQQRDMDGELVNEGLCHRYPLWGFARFQKLLQKLPDVSKKSKLKYEYKVENFVGQWQNRHSSDWCGEWEQKDG